MLPTFRHKHSTNLSLPRRYASSVQLICLTSTLPALGYAFLYGKLALEDTYAISLQTSSVEYSIAILWCLLAGYWQWHLTQCLMQQWCYRLEAKQAITRGLVLIFTISITWIISSHLLSVTLHPLVMAGLVSLLTFFKTKEGRVLLSGLILLVLSSVCLSGQIQYDPYRRLELMPPVDTQAMTIQATAVILIFSSWSQESLERRQLLRETILRWIPSDTHYRFVLGQPPQPKLIPLVQPELDSTEDLLIVPAPDTQPGQKLLEALRATRAMQYQTLFKTEDDMFVRWDQVLSEDRKDDWSGFVYHQMPSEEKEMPLLPDYTWHKFIRLSYAAVQMIVYTPHPHRYAVSDDISLSYWLMGFNIKPVHDRRILTVDTCEDDMIAKQLATQAFQQQLMSLYEHKRCLLDSPPPCALCYPCYGRSDDWRRQGLSCSDRGVSPDPALYPTIAQDVKDELGNSTDHWIIPNILSTQTSIYSNETHWHLLYWVCWTSGPETFTDRHWRALEMVWIHEPDAVIFMISNTLSQDFFDSYTDQGYHIHVVQFDQQRLLDWQWYFGPGTQDWLSRWSEWETGKFFYWHLTDYIRCLLLYHYGGTYMDMDALWIRVPPYPIEFIGSDYSQVISDRSWTLDDQGLYLPQGVMRFKRGWRLFREMAEAAFSAYLYDPECFNCGGPKAITSYVRPRRALLTQAGLTILPPHVLYPYNYLDIHQLLQPNPLALQTLKTQLHTSWNIHLFGKMTNHLPVQPGSMIDVVFEQFDLGLIGPSEVSLVAPKENVYQAISDRMRQDDVDQLIQLEPVPGKFQGLQVVYVRGKQLAGPIELEVETTIGRTRLMGTIGKRVVWSMEEGVSLQQINHVLQTLQYTPTPLMLANGGRDRIKIKLRHSKQNKIEEAQISMTILEPIEEDEPFE
ncbi:hypothetical protein BD560DRAFT_355051 [Blakeslea trispora]|nr:hypothetical protein BD560DRAFT_355051 [Blakeslea trispora]